MLNKINIFIIVKDHIATLKDYETKKNSGMDIILFFIVPIILAVLAFLSLKSMSSSLVTILITTQSIFAALLFNLLILVYDAIRKEQTDGIVNQQNDKTDERNNRRIFLKEIFSNVSFCVLISVVTIVLLIIFSFVTKWKVAKEIISFLAYYFVGVFILSLLMVLKRTHVLISTEK